MLALADRLRFCFNKILVLKTSALGLAVSLAIVGAESIGREVVASFSR